VGVAAEGVGEGVEAPGVNVRVEKMKGVGLEGGSKDPPIRMVRATPIRSTRAASSSTKINTHRPRLDTVAL
jgi:hypothetical protein